MTKKDYELIAEVLANSWQTSVINPFTGVNMYRELVNSFMTALELENPKFNRRLFLKACGVSNA